MMDEKRSNMKSDKGKDPLNLFDRAGIPWDKSSDEVWAGMKDKLGGKEKAHTIKRHTGLIRYAVAAAVIIMFGIPSLMRFYTKTIESGRAEHLDLVLPDGSTVALNAETSISYHPMWWRFKRDIKMEGEAYFEVVSGNSFVVESKLASTAVVGTSFNIVSRNTRYEVTCLTGKVKVFTSDSNAEVFLVKNQRAVLDNMGELLAESNIESGQSVSWTDNEFFFTSAELVTVIEEIERQYGISIALEAAGELYYTGNFSRNQDIETILDLVCKPFGIKFEKTKAGTYLLSADEQF